MLVVLTLVLLSAVAMTMVQVVMTTGHVSMEISEYAIAMTLVAMQMSRGVSQFTIATMSLVSTMTSQFTVAASVTPEERGIMHAKIAML